MGAKRFTGQKSEVVKLSRTDSQLSYAPTDANEIITYFSDL